MVGAGPAQTAAFDDVSDFSCLEFMSPFRFSSLIQPLLLMETHKPHLDLQTKYEPTAVCCHIALLLLPRAVTQTTRGN